MTETDPLWLGSMPESYERYLVPSIFQPWADYLADRVAMRRPSTVLELAAGTGVLTKALLTELPDATITATDISPAMVELGTETVPDAAWQLADAMDLTTIETHFDVIACQFGVMFFPDRSAAYAGIRAKLTEGGAFVFSSWGLVAEHTAAGALVAALDDTFPDDPPTFVTSLPHGYHQTEVIEADLTTAGFTNVSIQAVTLPGPPASARAVTTGFCLGTPLRGELEARGDLATLCGQIADNVEERLGKEPFTGVMSARVVTAAG